MGMVRVIMVRIEKIEEMRMMKMVKVLNKKKHVGKKGSVQNVKKTQEMRR